MGNCESVKLLQTSPHKEGLDVCLKSCSCMRCFALVLIVVVVVVVGVYRRASRGSGVSHRLFAGRPDVLTLF